MKRTEFDVVVVGSGAAGLSASLTAAKNGLRTLMIEKGDKWGGSTAKSAGMVWVPGNKQLQRVGGNDNMEMGRTYMKATVGDCTSDEMIDSFLTNGTRAMDFLTANCPGLVWRNMEGYPDYWLDAPGAQPQGRGVEAGAFDSNKLGKWKKNQMEAYFKPAVPLDLNSFDSADILLFASSWKPWARLARLTARNIKHLCARRTPRTMGMGLTGALMEGCLRAGVEIAMNTALKDLIVEDDAVRGIVVTHEGKESRIRAAKGVILACGGFERNAQMRQKYQRHPINGTWTVGAETNTGDGIQVGLQHGAAIDNMADAIWSPVIQLPRSSAWTPIVIEDEERFIVPDRSLPHTVIVNGQGKRFMNEALPYCTAGQGLYGGHFGKGEGDAENLPAWLIFDHQFRSKYVFGYGHMPVVPLPREYFESGAMIQADSVDELAQKIDVPVEQLRLTLERFNDFARTGIDEDFHRGENEHDRFYGDRYHEPNPSLGTVEKGPFYATQVYPGDIGTSGGLVINPQAQVTREDGSVIDGLYAAGNTTKSIVGHTYTAGGTSIGAALVFGYVAARTIAEKAGRNMVAH